jgi:pilus assembly protein Flp/PilA
MERGKEFIKDESGAAAVEYSLLLALIALAIIASVQLLGQNLVLVFQKAANQLPSG